MVSFQVTEERQVHWKLEANLLFLRLRKQLCQLKLLKILLHQLHFPATFIRLYKQLLIIPVCIIQTLLQVTLIVSEPYI